MVSMAFDPDDADRRREGVSMLSKRDWGLQEPYLKGYATLLQNDSDPSVRSAAVLALGRAGDRTYLPDVIHALDDTSPAVRWDAAVALDNMPDETAIDPLREHVRKDPAVDVRATCARALRHYPQKSVVATLKRCLLDSDFSVRYQAHEAMVEIVGHDWGYEFTDWPEDPLASAASIEEQPPKSRWWSWQAFTKRFRRKSSPSEK